MFTKNAIHFLSKKHQRGFCVQKRFASYFFHTADEHLHGSKLIAAIANMRLSNKAVTYESYTGPKYALLSGIEIV